MKEKSLHLLRTVSLVAAALLILGTIPFLSLDSRASGLTQSQENIVERADYMYNSTWVSQKTVSSWKGQSSFEEGKTYRIPYAWPVTAGKWVGDASYGVTVDEFLIATKDPNSEFYTKQSYYEYNTGSYAPYYGNDCSTFVSFCWGLTARQTTSSLPNVSTLIGNVTQDNIKKRLLVGDALDHVGSHVVLITDITYDQSGNIATIEITEQTPPQLKRTNHTVESLVSYYGANYKIYRYGGTVPSAPEAGTNPDLYTVPTSPLCVGDRGSEVSWLQAALCRMGYTVAIDGIFGSETEGALISFCEGYGIHSTGVADTNAVELLKTLLANKLGYYVTTASSLNVRSGPGTSHSILTSVSNGTKVAVVGFNEAGTWANIVYNDLEGWVSKSYLSYERKFSYTLNYNTNIPEGLPSESFIHDRIINAQTPPPHPENNVFLGWQLLRTSDWMWYDGSAWVADQADSKLYSPNEAIAFTQDMLNSKAGDDSFYLCAVWGDAPATVKKGDLDENGTVNSIDSNTLKRILSGVTKATETQLISGDINDDGALNSIDTNLLSRYIAGVLGEIQ